MIKLAGQLGSTAMPVPLSYREIADDLSERIRAGEEYPPGSRMPTLQELADLYSVSVSTIQRALGLVEDRGLIVTAQGRGIFVVDVLPRG